MATQDPVFDPSLYVRAPAFSLAEGVTLARALVAACPKALLPAVKKPLDRLKSRADEADSALLSRQRQNTLSEEDTRALDAEMDGCFSGLDLRLAGYIALPQATCPKSLRAKDLRQKLFGDKGLSFLRETYVAQLAAMRTISQRIREDKLTPDIDDLCGPEFLQHISKLLPRYEAMVQTVLTRETGVGENLQFHRQALQRNIVSYASAVCGTVDDADPSTTSVALQALIPLDNLKSSLLCRRTPTEPEPEPAVPVPADPVPPKT